MENFTLTSLEQIQIPEFTERLQEFEKLGGALGIKAFRAQSEATDRANHCAVAKKTIELLHEDCERQLLQFNPNYYEERAKQ